MTARRILKALLLVLSAAIMAIGLLHVLFGPAIVPGSLTVNATMDSEDRFYGTIFLAYGAVVAWCAFDVDARSRQIRLVALVFFGGGVARLLSVAAKGLPDPFFVVMAAIELLLPVVIVLLVFRVERSGTGRSPAVAEM